MSESHLHRHHVRVSLHPPEGFGHCFRVLCEGRSIAVGFALSVAPQRQPEHTCCEVCARRHRHLRTLVHASPPASASTTHSLGSGNDPARRCADHGCRQGVTAADVDEFQGKDCPDFWWFQKGQEALGDDDRRMFRGSTNSKRVGLGNWCDVAPRGRNRRPTGELGDHRRDGMSLQWTGTTRGSRALLRTTRILRRRLLPTQSRRGYRADPRAVRRSRRSRHRLRPGGRPSERRS